MTQPLRRDRPAPPVRSVHIGLGAFFRAHQAVYTHNADPDWGIAAFTGRRPDAARTLSGQDGLYTLLVRGPTGDSAQVMGPISAAYDGADLAGMRRHVADPAVTVVTLTITEAGYTVDEPAPAGSPPISALHRLVAGLAARQHADAGPITVVPCDNLPHNGSLTRDVVRRIAERSNPALAAWIEREVRFAGTMVDRITPGATEADCATVARLAGYADAAPVVTEPFSEWVIAGDFPADRPAWESAGARLVEDVGPDETRKLWLLNGAHSLLAYAAPTRGHETVDAAIADPVCLSWVQAWWTEATRYLPPSAVDVAAYQDALLERFGNPRIRHLLEQVAADGSAKLPIRIVPVLRAERSVGRIPAGAVTAIAGWLVHLQRGRGIHDPRSEELRAAASATPVTAAARAVLELIAPDLADDGELVRAVGDAGKELKTP